MNLRKAKVFNCDNCKLLIGRYVNASRNILLRYFTKKVKYEFDNEIESFLIQSLGLNCKFVCFVHKAQNIQIETKRSLY